MDHEGNFPQISNFSPELEGVFVFLMISVLIPDVAAQKKRAASGFQIPPVNNIFHIQTITEMDFLRSTSFRFTEDVSLAWTELS